jgi:hypothetical protein
VSRATWTTWSRGYTNRALAKQGSVLPFQICFGVPPRNGSPHIPHPESEFFRLQVEIRRRVPSRERRPHGKQGEEGPTMSQTQNTHGRFGRVWESRPCRLIRSVCRIHRGYLFRLRTTRDISPFPKALRGFSTWSHRALLPPPPAPSTGHTPSTRVSVTINCWWAVSPSTHGVRQSVGHCVCVVSVWMSGYESLVLEIISSTTTGSTTVLFRKPSHVLECRVGSPAQIRRFSGLLLESD